MVHTWVICVYRCKCTRKCRKGYVHCSWKMIRASYAEIFETIMMCGKERSCWNYTNEIWKQFAKVLHNWGTILTKSISGWRTSELAISEYKRSNSFFCWCMSICFNWTLKKDWEFELRLKKALCLWVYIELRFSDSTGVRARWLLYRFLTLTTELYDTCYLDQCFVLCNKKPINNSSLV